MSKSLKRLIAVCNLFVLLLMLASCIKDYSKLILGSDLPQYAIKNKDFDAAYLSSVFSCDGQLCFIHPVSNELSIYKKENTVTVLNNIKMDYALISKHGIIYTFDNELFIKADDKDEPLFISQLGYAYNVEVADGLIFYINKDNQLCSYSFDLDEKKVLSESKVSSFKIYGEHIIYDKTKMRFSHGIFATDFKGEHTEMIADAYAFCFVILNDCIFFSNDFNKLFKIDLLKNSYTIVYGGVSPFSLQQNNDRLYFQAISEKDSTKEVLIEADSDFEHIKVMLEYDRTDDCFFKDLDEYQCIVHIKKGVGSDILIYDNNGLSKTINLKDTIVSNIMNINNYMVINAKTNGEKKLYLYTDKWDEIECIS